MNIYETEKVVRQPGGPIVRYWWFPFSQTLETCTILHFIFTNLNFGLVG